MPNTIKGDILKPNPSAEQILSFATQVNEIDKNTNHFKDKIHLLRSMVKWYGDNNWESNEKALIKKIREIWNW